MSRPPDMTVAPWEQLDPDDLDRPVTVPVGVLARALRKARYEYENVAELCGHNIVRQDECWAEFEQLASYHRRARHDW